MFSSVQLSLRLLNRTKIPRLQKLQSLIRKENATGWAHRQPIAVINEKMTFDNDEESSKPTRKLKPRKYIGENLEHKPLKEKTNHKRPVIATSASIESDETYNEDGTPRLHKFTQDEKKLNALILELRSRKKREKNKQILLEGWRLIQDAIQAGLVPQIIMYSRPSDIARLTLPKKGVKIYRVPYNTLQMWSSLTTSPGIFGVFQSPSTLEKEPNADTLPLTIICDNVREPGNMGAILRAAAGVGCEKIILIKGCVDVWDTKVLRSAVGAHFRLSISKSVDWDEIDSLISSTAKIYIADSDGGMKSVVTSDDSKTEKKCDSNDGNAQEFIKPESNEDLGASDQSSADRVDCVADKSLEVDSSDEKVEKSMKSEAELGSNASEQNSADEVRCTSEENLTNSYKSDTEEYSYDKSFEKCISSAEDVMQTSPSLQTIIAKQILMSIPVKPYYAPDYASNEVILIVGGETEGLSYESVELAQKREGVRVHIPLTNNVESLNTGVALGIVAFEVKRQFAVRKQSFE
ncbi:rRNA methyltransferase 3, mitochondrial [Venturia canescens]|uniref:rRNA methyltransferase 3, mitochondrial n=1 Tax=Venturia canescens TaxID=32260 RepID=UPI001C9C8BD4|nr:rRNA methyltransferase 3, mitochondrial [Venturia canescens]